MNEYSSRNYDSDEVSRIIRRALKLKRVHGITYQDLVDTAKDIGLDLQTIETAMELEQKAAKKERIWTLQRNRSKVGFYSHLWSYLMVNIALLIINNFTPGPWWFYWSVIGWGIGVAFHFEVTFFHQAKKAARRKKSRRLRPNFMMCSH